MLLFGTPIEGLIFPPPSIVFITYFILWVDFGFSVQYNFVFSCSYHTPTETYYLNPRTANNLQLTLPAHYYQIWNFIKKLVSNLLFNGQSILKTVFPKN